AGGAIAADEGADRHSRAEAFRDRHDVGPDPRPLVREPLAGAAHAALDLVEHQQPAVLVADAADLPEVLDRRRPDAAFALDHLEEDGDDVRIRATEALDRADVVERDANEPLDERAEAGLDLGVAGRRQRRQRASVERAFVDDDLRPLDAAVVAELARDLERSLVRLEPGVAEEDVAQARELAQLRGELLLERNPATGHSVYQ